jgi:hypothetical protein
MEILAGFVGGVVTGLGIEYFRFRHSLKIEKIKRLSRYLESAYPLVEKLSQDTGYAANTQLDKDDECRRILKKVTISIEEYSRWFIQFKTDGMMPELDSIDPDLLSRFVGMFMYARLCKEHGLEYLSQNIQELSRYCRTCRQMLKHRLSN